MNKPTGFDERKARAEQSLTELLASSERPVVLSSFGKDSLCLLALIESLRVRVEVAYFELGAVKKAHRFAQRHISGMDFATTLLRPHKTLIVAGAAGADVAYEFFLVSGDAFQIVGATFDPSPSARLTCGLTVGLVKEGRHDPYGWDAIISGRRSSDVDPTVGSLKFDSEVAVLENGTRIAMPLLDWADEDVAYFLSRHPSWSPDSKRYFSENGRYRSWQDETVNPDWAPICVRCHSAHSGDVIICPLMLRAAPRANRLERVELASGQVSPTVMF
jgi:hypothetical protein